MEKLHTMEDEYLNELDKLCAKFRVNIPTIKKNLKDDPRLPDVLARAKTIKMYQKKLEKLLQIPKIEQKSQEWYEARQKITTASDWAQALGCGKFGTQKQFMEKKILPQDESAFSASNPFFKFGNMFEPVSIQIYSHLQNVTVHEFGLLLHPHYDFFGASPDGISDIGMMLEIKNPYKRQIDGTIPLQYLFQMQGQMDVCDLDECHYFECQIELYENREEFFQNYGDSKIKGVVIEDGGNLWTYSDIVFEDKRPSKDYYINWLDLHSKPESKQIYWLLDNMMMKRVFRDKDFINTKMEELREVWNKVLYYREHLDKFEFEILKTISIETEVFHSRFPKPKPTKFLELEEDDYEI